MHVWEQFRHILGEMLERKVGRIAMSRLGSDLACTYVASWCTTAHDNKPHVAYDCIYHIPNDSFTANNALFCMTKLGWLLFTCCSIFSIVDAINTCMLILDLIRVLVLPQFFISLESANALVPINEFAAKEPKGMCSILVAWQQTRVLKIFCKN